MQARLKSSKKWTAFPQEYADQIQSVFTENFAEPLKDSKLIIEGRIYPQEILLRVGVNKNGELKQANFEVSMDYSQEKQDAVERIHNCIDAAASMMMEYFESEGEVEFPRTWHEYPFQGKSVYLQFTTENSDLEAQANVLLGEAGDDALVHEEESDDEEESTSKSPRMFGGGGTKKKKGDMH
jgi:hypothetical protein